MKKIKIPVTWLMAGNIEIEADSIENAIKIAKNKLKTISLPTQSSYIDDSMTLCTDDIDYIKHINNER